MIALNRIGCTAVYDNTQLVGLETLCTCIRFVPNYMGEHWLAIHLFRLFSLGLERKLAQLEARKGELAALQAEADAVMDEFKEGEAEKQAFQDHLLEIGNHFFLVFTKSFVTY